MTDTVCLFLCPGRLAPGIVEGNFVRYLGSLLEHWIFVG